MRILVKPTFRWHINLIISSLLLTSVLGVEESQPAIFLSPRNFNPHPYEASYDLRDQVDTNRVGPVVFPPTPPEEDETVTSNILAVLRGGEFSHPVDSHPYPKLARKHKHFPGRFNHLDNTNINPRVYEALSNHAAKVLSEPASQLRKDYTLSSLSNQRKNYAFSYKVVDHLTGDDFSHTQSQNSRATNGEYRVKLPDGRVQIVSYIADKNGYKADVKYTENDVSAGNIPIPDSSRIPILPSNSYDYQYDISGSHLPALDGNGASHAPSRGDYGSYDAPEGAAPRTGLDPKGHFSASRPSVEIYPGGGEINNYVGSTVAPYLLEGAKGYHQDVVGSTVAPPLQEYTPVYAVY